MLGPRSRSEIDFFREKKVRKSREHREPPPRLATCVICDRSERWEVKYGESPEICMVTYLFLMLITFDVKR